MTPERFTLRSITKEVLGELNFEKGILYTLRALTLYPAKAIKTYLYEDRTKLVKSSRFLFISVAIATFLTLEFGGLSTTGASVNNTSVQTEEPAPSEITGKIGANIWTLLTKLFSDYLNLMFLLTVPVFAIVTYLIFFKNGMNYAEHLVANTFIWGYLTYVYIPFIPFLTSIQVPFVVISIIYSTLVFYLLFKGSGKFIILKAIFANVMWFIIFPIFILLLSLLLLTFGMVNP